MKIKSNEVKQFLKRLTIFDWLIVSVVVVGLVVLGVFILKQERWVKVEVRVVLDGANNPPYWLANDMRKGDAQFDFMGRKTAEVLDIRNYEQGGVRKVVYLTLNLKVQEDRMRKKLKYEHRPLEIGKPIDLEMGSTAAYGVVIYIDGLPDNRIWEDKIVETRLVDDSNKVNESFGVPAWRVEVINVGDKMKDNWGNVVAEVLEKKIVPATVYVTTADGRIVERQDPVKKDAFFTLRLKTVKENGTNFFLDEYKVKVGYGIPLSLDQIDTGPEIIRIIQ